MRNECSIKLWGLVLDELLQLCDLSNFLVCEYLVLLVSIDNHSRGIISTVFEARKTCEKGAAVSEWLRGKKIGRDLKSYLARVCR